MNKSNREILGDLLLPLATMLLVAVVLAPDAPKSNRRGAAPRVGCENENEVEAQTQDENEKGRENMDDAQKKAPFMFLIPISSLLLAVLLLTFGITLAMHKGEVPRYLNYAKPDVREFCGSPQAERAYRNFASPIFGAEAGRLVALEDCVRELDPDAFVRMRAELSTDR